MLLKGVIMLLVVCSNAWNAMAQAADLSRLVEWRVREGLPNFIGKARSGRHITVAYLGGSITEAAGGWREQSLQKMKERYPAATFEEINAGVSGTGSDLGVFRVQRDVIDHKPDLVLVEFAVNDGGAAPERIHEAMEGIVRKIWRANRHTDICFVYTLSEYMADTLKTGRLWPSMLAMEQIAEYYGIPSVMFAKPIMDLYNSGKLVFTGSSPSADGKMVFSPDRVHPYPATGHKIYAETLMRFIELAGQRTGRLVHRLTRPYSEDNWEDAQMLPVSDLTRAGWWEDLSNTDDSVATRFRDRLPNLIYSNVPGSSLSIRFNGRMIGLYDIIGPGCGQFKVMVDCRDTVLVPRFDKYATYWRTNYFLLPQLAAGAHEVVFSVAEEKLDKEAILNQATIFQRGANAVGEQKRYSQNGCYAGVVLLLGKAVRSVSRNKIINKK